jgi:acetylornithine aminotransferase apoenzyme (EC 2.6.1.11)
MDDDVAALFVEPIQGEAGVLDLPAGYLAEARRLTAQHGALLILDEIQTGAGRTGDWFAYQRDLAPGTRPDAVTSPKASAVASRSGRWWRSGRQRSCCQPGQHGTTFGGNPLATATANAVLGEIERAGLVENARVRGEQLRSAILGIGSPLITDIQGRGCCSGSVWHGRWPAPSRHGLSRWD